MKHVQQKDARIEGEGLAALFAHRAQVVRKLDPRAPWSEDRKENGVLVERQFERGQALVVKTLRGPSAGLLDNELTAYLRVFTAGDRLPRIATFHQLTNDGVRAIKLKDYGPSLQDWMNLIGPQRLSGFLDTKRPRSKLPRSPWLAPGNLLSLVRALLEALHPFHECGYVHGDIKADNFCISCMPAFPQEGAVLEGWVELDTLTAIDLGLSLLETPRRQPLNSHGQALYIGAHRKDYIWPVLLAGAENATEAERVAGRFAERSGADYPARLNQTAQRDARKKRLGDKGSSRLRYVSDHYLLAQEMAALGTSAALDRLDWRVDFFSLAHLVSNLLKSLTEEGDREFDAAPEPWISYLQALPARLKDFDTSPFLPPPPAPHEQIIGEINDLIGEDQFRRIPYRVVPEANPLPWYQAPEESPLEPSETLLVAAETVLRAGDEGIGQPFNAFRDTPDTPLLIFLPGGDGLIGSPQDEPDRGSDEALARIVRLRPFAMGKYPVTFEEWDRFLAATGYPAVEGQDAGWGRGSHPVINVAPADVAAYLAWLNSRVGWEAGDFHRYRLPTPEEWEFAARAGTTTPYYTGRQLTPDHAHYLPTEGFPDQEYPLPRDRTAPVGSYPANPWNLHDMLGNVWEFVETSPNASGNKHKMLRGGSWLNGPGFLRAAASRSAGGNERSSHIGFRVVRSLGPSP